MTIIHTTRPPNDDTWIIVFCATASQMEPTNAWSAVQQCARVTKGKYMQAPQIKWGAEVVATSTIWHITQDPKDDAPLCWMQASAVPDALACMMSAQIAAGPDLAPQLAAAEAKITKFTQAIAVLNESIK